MQHSSFPFLTFTGLTPPFPVATVTENIASYDVETAGTNISASTTIDGRSTKRASSSLPSRLLTLIRSVEKSRGGDIDDDDDDLYEENVNEAVVLLNHLVALYSRRGLLQGDHAKAERILSAPGSTYRGGSDGNQSRNNNNNSNRGGVSRNGSDLRISAGGRRQVAFPSSSQQPQEDEALIFTSILRLLHSKNAVDTDAASRIKKSKPLEKDEALLISLAAELIVAISQHVKVRDDDTTTGTARIGTCILAEYELLAQSGKALLSGLLSAMHLVELRAREMMAPTVPNGRGCMALVDLDECLHVQPLNSTMKAAASLISLFGTKLSRSTALLHDLKRASWTLMTASDDSVQDTAARLVACLPLAGGTDQTSPSDLWTMQVSDTLSMASLVLNGMAPLTKGIDTDGGTTTRISDGIVRDHLTGWMNFVRSNVSNHSARLRCFSRYTRGLTKVFHFLLLRDGMEMQSSDATLMDAQVDVDKVLDVVESFVSFPLTAETAYYKSKRRLRDEVIEDGLLSLRDIMTVMANHIKHMGHDILDCALAAIGGPVLFPYARRIIRISYASILTSSSGPVRRALDPTNSVQLEGKKRRWLHLSIPMRTIAIRTLERTIMSFGVDISSMTRTNSTGRSAEVNTDEQRAVTIVIGCLVEQIGLKQIGAVEMADDWGSLAEQVDMVTAAAECLRAAVNSCGDYLPIPIRSLIESVTVSGLSGICEVQQSKVKLFSWPSVKVAFLRLAKSCVSTPWSDGASSSLRDVLSMTARDLENDTDGLVASTANAAVRLCDDLSNPRAPALLYVSRALVEAREGRTILSTSTTMDATTLAMTIGSSRNVAPLHKKMDEAQVEKKTRMEEKRRREEEERMEKETERKKVCTERTVMVVDQIEHASTQADESASEWLTQTRDGAPDSSQPSLTMQNKSQDPAAITAEALEECGPVLASTARADDERSSSSFNVDLSDRNVSTNIDAKPKAIDGSSATNADTQKVALSDDENDDEGFPEIFDGGPDSDDE